MKEEIKKSFMSYKNTLQLHPNKLPHQLMCDIFSIVRRMKRRIPKTYYINLGTYHGEATSLLQPTTVERFLGDSNEPDYAT